MNKKTRNLLIIGGVAVVGYILWKRGVFGGKKSDAKFSGFTADDNFYNLAGRRAVGGGDDTCPACPPSGQCWNGGYVPKNATTIEAGIAGQKTYVPCTPASSASARR
jgi:hypothetical protein